MDKRIMFSSNLTNVHLASMVNKEVSIAVVIPCYNVEKSICQVVGSLPVYVQHIILVNDASRDGTGNLIDNLRSDRIHGIHLHQNLGIGGAVLRGYEEAVRLGAGIIVKMDGDGQMDPCYIPALLYPIVLGKADYTKGNRFLHSRQLKSMPFLRRIGNVGLSFLVKLASGYWNIFDPTNGFTAINAKILPLLDKERLAPRFFFETSMLIELGLLRAWVQDVSIPALYRDEESSLSELNSLIDFPPKLFRALLHRILVQYFIRDFSAISLFLVSGTLASLFGLSWGIYHWIRSAQLSMAASTGTVMIAVIPLILGLQLLLQTIVMDIQNVPKEVIDDEFRLTSFIKRYAPKDLLQEEIWEKYNVPSNS